MANPSIRLHLEVGGHWRPFINIPEVELHKLTTRPLKWLRYLGWCIHGQPGELRATVDGTQVEDDHLTAFLQNYYHVSPRPARFIDINAIDELTHSSYCHKASRKIAWRATSYQIVPYCKGDEYMECLSSHREEAAPVLEIGDIRNGVLLYSGLHRAYGTGEIAFLLTPNPYLLTNVPTISVPAPQSRLTLQHIVPQDCANSLVGPHNTDAWLCTTDIRPRPYLLHFYYACAILKRWGQPADLGLQDHPLDDADIQAIYYELSDSSPENAANLPRVTRGTESRPIPSSTKGTRTRPDLTSPATLSFEYVMDRVLSVTSHEDTKSNKVSAWLQDVCV